MVGSADYGTLFGIGLEVGLKTTILAIKVCCVRPVEYEKQSWKLFDPKITSLEFARRVLYAVVLRHCGMCVVGNGCCWV